MSGDGTPIESSLGLESATSCCEDVGVSATARSPEISDSLPGGGEGLREICLGSKVVFCCLGLDPPGIMAARGRLRPGATGWGPPCLGHSLGRCHAPIFWLRIPGTNPR